VGVGLTAAAWAAIATSTKAKLMTACLRFVVDMNTSGVVAYLDATPRAEGGQPPLLFMFTYKY
jgi:hypothetical protein